MLIIEKRYFRLMWSLIKNHKKYFFFAVFFICFNSIVLGGSLSMILPFINQFLNVDASGTSQISMYFNKISILFEKIVGNSDNKQIYSMMFFFFMMSFSAFVKFISVYANSWLTSRVTYDCRSHIYKAICKMKFSEIQKDHRGKYIQLLLAETRSVYAVLKQLLSVLSTLTSVAIIFTLLVMLSFKLLVVLCVSYLSTIWITLIITKSIKKISHVAFDNRAQLASQVSESVWGIKYIRILQVQSIISEKIDKISFETEDLARQLMVKQGLLPFVSKICSLLGVGVLVSFWSTSEYFSKDLPTISCLITFLILVGRLAISVGTISKEYGTIYANVPALGRIYDFIISKHEQELDGSITLDSLFMNKIQFKNIFFKYGKDDYILENMDFTINKGDYIGIVGESGSGKSTFLNLLPRLYDSEKGNIFFDQNNIKDFKLNFLRKNIGLLPQDIFLFNSSIRELLLLGKGDATENEMYEVLRRVELADFVEKLEKKLDTVITTDGGNISGGQKQRIALATLFLKAPEIIILDEATSAVDINTERYILDFIKEMHNMGKTIINSAHKESALTDAEYIYELKNKRLVLVGGKKYAK